jgi:hypothetical protein
LSIIDRDDVSVTPPLASVRRWSVDLATRSELVHSTYVSLALADIAVLREEIKTRTTAQQTFVNIAVTAAGVLISVAFTAEQPGLFFVVPWVVGPLGLFWIDHHVVIHVCGRSITIAKETLTKRVAFPPLMDDSGRQLLDPILGTENTKLETPPSMFRAWIQVVILFVALPAASALCGLYAVAGNDSFSGAAQLAVIADGVILLLVFVQWWKWCANYERLDFSDLQFRVLATKHKLPYWDDPT